MGNQYYKKYIKKEDEVEEKPSYVKLFFGAFFMMLVLFVLIAGHLSSSVDTAIGENDEGDIKESGLGVRHLIDSRLKFIQMEDTDKLPSTQAPKVVQPQVDDSYSNPQQSEVQTQPYRGQTQNPYGTGNAYPTGQGNNSFPSTGYGQTNGIRRPATINTNQPTSRQMSNGSSYKVYIGSYSTLEQARVAQSIIQDSSLGVAPYVKSIGNGSYTIQVGTYSDVGRAQGLTNELRRNHFPARMVQN